MYSSALLPRLRLPLRLPDHTARMTVHFLQWTVCSRAEVMPCLSELTVPINRGLGAESSRQGRRCILSNLNQTVRSFAWGSRGLGLSTQEGRPHASFGIKVVKQLIRATPGRGRAKLFISVREGATSDACVCVCACTCTCACV